MKLALLEAPLSVIHFSSQNPIPEWVWSSRFYSITRTSDELSIFCETACIPHSEDAAHGWRAFRVVGSLDFSMNGIISSLSLPLAAKQISIFSISTYDTDYMVVLEERLADAMDVLRRAGHQFV